MISSFVNCVFTERENFTAVENEHVENTHTKLNIDIYIYILLIVAPFDKNVSCQNIFERNSRNLNILFLHFFFLCSATKMFFYMKRFSPKRNPGDLDFLGN